MSKVKYKYNPRTLNYEKVEVSWKERILKALPIVAGSLVFATIVVIIAFSFFKSPKEKAILRDYKQLEAQYELLKKELENIDLVLNDIQKRDDKLYRIILESEPYPAHKRQMSTGGSNRYRDLEGYASYELVSGTRKILDRVEKRLYAQSKSFDEVIALAQKKEELLRCIPAIIPIINKEITAHIGPFGWRIDPIYRTQAFHSGMDFPCKTGTKIRATGDGVVANVESGYWGYGNIVLINHGFGYQTMYAHLSGFNCKPGQKIKRGDVIGFAGSTGKSTAPHLHYEVIKNGEKVNPVNYYFNDLTPTQYEELLKSSSEAGTSFD